MSGTKLGAQKGQQTKLEKLGGPEALKQWYIEIGKKGGEASASHVEKGFSSPIIGRDGLTGKERAKTAGAKGGSASRTRPVWKRLG